MARSNLLRLCVCSTRQHLTFCYSRLKLVCNQNSLSQRRLCRLHVIDSGFGPYRTHLQQSKAAQSGSKINPPAPSLPILKSIRPINTIPVDPSPHYIPILLPTNPPHLPSILSSSSPSNEFQAYHKAFTTSPFPPFQILPRYASSATFVRRSTSPFPSAFLPSHPFPFGSKTASEWQFSEYVNNSVRCGCVRVRDSGCRLRRSAS
jgi:hypothetical protein